MHSGRICRLTSVLATVTVSESIIDKCKCLRTSARTLTDLSTLASSSPWRSCGVVATKLNRVLRIRMVVYYMGELSACACLVHECKNIGIVIFSTSSSLSSSWSLPWRTHSVCKLQPFILQSTNPTTTTQSRASTNAERSCANSIYAPLGFLGLRFLRNHNARDHLGGHGVKSHTQSQPPNGNQPTRNQNSQRAFRRGSGRYTIAYTICVVILYNAQNKRLKRRNKPKLLRQLNRATLPTARRKCFCVCVCV